MSWQATAAPTSAGIPRIPSVFFAFASSETVHLACGGHADDESAREICAHENSAQLSLLSLSPQPTVFLPLLAPFLFRPFVSNFGEKSKHEDRLKAQRVLVIIFGY